MRSLDHIEIRGFKSIRSVALALRPLNVLIGANGAGKSNFVSAFGLLNEIVERRLQVHVARSGGADALLHHGQKVTPELALRLAFGPNGYQAILGPSSDGNLFFVREECWYNGPGHDRPFEINLGTGAKETGLHEQAKQHPGGIASHVLEDLRSWKVYHFHDTSSAAKMKQSGDLGDNRELRTDASNLAAFLFLLQQKHEDHYQRIVETVKLVAPFFHDFALRPDPLNEQKIRLEWSEAGSDAYFSGHALSDGTLRFICLATLLLQPVLPSTILIDEPELGLHPYAIQVLASLLRVASKRAQVIASTQSVSLVNQLEPDDLIVVDRRDGQSVFRRPGRDEIAAWLDAYGLGDLWEKNLLGGRPA
jgi:predicted ATPase